jgi:hypothetical protein
MPVCRSARPTPPAAIRCGRCGRDIPLEVSEALAGRGRSVSGVRGRGILYRRKDFDPKVGLTVVIIGALISAGFYWFGLDLIAYSILAAAALIDLIVYGRLKDITVCYRCHAEFRGAVQPTALAFDLHIADELEQEYERRIGRR